MNTVYPIYESFNNYDTTTSKLVSILELITIFIFVLLVEHTIVMNSTASSYRRSSTSTSITTFVFSSLHCNLLYFI